METAKYILATVLIWTDQLPKNTYFFKLFKTEFDFYKVAES
jgi:hypothetical protein